MNETILFSQAIKGSSICNLGLKQQPQISGKESPLLSNYSFDIHGHYVAIEL